MYYRVWVYPSTKDIVVDDKGLEKLKAKYKGKNPIHIIKKGEEMDDVMDEELKKTYAKALAGMVGN